MNSAASRPTQQAKPESLYFAYGSNLQLAQIAQRCPESRYMGIAYLHGYRFQINQRGFANVVPSPNDVVAGLCYLISAEDEARLDINEGVAIGSYEKEILDVEISLPNAAVAGRRVSEIIGYGLLRGSVDGERQVTSVRGEPLQALVYVSRRYTTEGDPRDEYVDRMNLGVTDALKLGVSEEYVKKYIRTYIPLR